MRFFTLGTARKAWSVWPARDRGHSGPHAGECTTGNYSSRGTTPWTHHSHPRSKIEQETPAKLLSLELMRPIGALVGALKRGAFQTPNGRLVSDGSDS